MVVDGYGIDVKCKNSYLKISFFRRFNWIDSVRIWIDVMKVRGWISFGIKGGKWMNIVLVGNLNSGKMSLFNLLIGLN